MYMYIYIYLVHIHARCWVCTCMIFRWSQLAVHVATSIVIAVGYIPAGLQSGRPAYNRASGLKLGLKIYMYMYYTDIFIQFMYTCTCIMQMFVSAVSQLDDSGSGAGEFSEFSCMYLYMLIKNMCCMIWSNSQAISLEHLHVHVHVYLHEV